MSTQRPDISFYTSSMGEGGAQRTVANLVTGFVERGLDAELLLLRAEGPYLESLPSDTKVIELEANRALGSIPELVSYLRDREPEVLFSTMEYLNVVALLSKLLSRVSTRTAIRAANVQSEKSRSGFRNSVQYQLAKYLYPKADHFIALSKYVRNDFSEYYGINKDEISVIYNPVAIEEIQELATEMVDIPFCDNNSDLIVNVGSLTEQKDIQTTIKAFKKITECRDAQLLILGKGEQRDGLIRLATTLGIEDSVHLPGFVDNPFAYMSEADVFVLSSRWEGFGHVIVEAMACGTPVVSTNCPGGPAEILENGKYGALVPVGDTTALANAVVQLLENPLEKEILLERAVDFDYKRITSQYEDVIFG